MIRTGARPLALSSSTAGPRIPMEANDVNTRRRDEGCKFVVPFA